MDPNQETTVDKIIIEPEKPLKQVSNLPNFTIVGRPKYDPESISKNEIINALICAATAVFSIIIVYYESERFYSTITGLQNGSEVVLKKSNESDTTVTLLRVSNMFLTVIMEFFIYRQYLLSLNKKKGNKDLSPDDSLKSSGLLIPMILEMAFIGIFTPPYFDYTVSGNMLHGTYTYSFDSIISILTTFRICEVWKVYFLMTFWKSSQVCEIARKIRVSPSNSLTMRADLKVRPIYLLLFLVSSIIFISGFAIRALERSYKSSTMSSLDFDYLTNGFWVSIITFTTVGYGDGYPSTHLGRFVMILTALIGITFISLYIVTLLLMVTFKKQEIKAFNTIIQQKNEQTIRKNASNIIKSAFYLKKIKENPKEIGHFGKFLVGCAEFKGKLLNFDKVLKSSIVNHSKSKEIIIHLEHKIVKEIDEIRKNLIGVNYIGQRLNELSINQKKMIIDVEKVWKGITEIQNLLKESNLKGALVDSGPALD